jgi:uncharacterized membrane protein YraQ (UPF0718 family)/nucleoside-triphosphatase THEP1
MKTKLTIVTGFLGSGKTTLINRILSQVPLDESVVVLLGEVGEIEVDKHRSGIQVAELSEGRFSAEHLHAVWEHAQPKHVIVEHNGMEPISEALVEIEDELSEFYHLQSVIHVINAPMFDILSRNIGAVLSEQVSQSDTILITQEDRVAAASLEGLKQKVHSAAPRATMYIGKEASVIARTAAPRKKLLSYRGANLLFIGAIIGLLAVLLAGRGFLSPDALRQLLVFNTIFIGILVEALPFILIGLLASSLLQVLVPSDALLRVLPRNTYLGIAMASVAGLIFPVCDCAVIPVAGRLIKKGVPVPVATTYMMASPIVDPVVIMATLYAFPGSPIIAIYRVALGLIVAITIGLVFAVTSSKREEVVLDRLSTVTCQCGFCSEEPASSQGFAFRVRGVFRHVETEFFAIIPFVIMGAAASGLIHTFVPQSFMAQLGSSKVASLVIMMVMAYLMSMCSTSDAFVGKSFLGPFGLTPVLGFLTFGPMMDLKNTLIMIGMFERKFVLKLAFFAFAACFAAVLVLTPLVF